MLSLSLSRLSVFLANLNKYDHPFTMCVIGREMCFLYVCSNLIFFHTLLFVSVNALVLDYYAFSVTLSGGLFPSETFYL